jgi:hypothetical protein
MVAKITEVTFEATAHAQQGRFSVPRRIIKLLGGADGSKVFVEVVAGGKSVYFGNIQLKSGTEVYTIRDLQSKQPIRVTVRLADDSDGVRAL